MVNQIGGITPTGNIEEFLTGIYGKAATQTRPVDSKAEFGDMLMSALNYVNEKQQTSAALSQRMITDPDSLDVHDVTTAIQEAAMSLELAQNVISRMVTAWNEITTTR
ncbi:MAG: flagellar hook-basal body complex protein FliE [Spirochaetaceae bacterium]|nr:flagellar hook-basal body complex protein FliE [Spirochaetaceae bacterium]